MFDPFSIFYSFTCPKSFHFQRKFGGSPTKRALHQKVERKERKIQETVAKQTSTTATASSSQIVETSKLGNELTEEEKAKRAAKKEKNNQR